jgi:hypothetical protein
VWRVKVERERIAQIWLKMADAIRSTRGGVQAAGSSCLLARAVGVGVWTVCSNMKGGGRKEGASRCGGLLHPAPKDVMDEHSSSALC